MTVDECYRFLQFITRKNQSVSLTPSEFNTVFNSAQKTWFDFLLGKIIIAPHIALGQNERIAERLKPFKVAEEPISTVNQIAPYPQGFHALTNMVNDATGQSLSYIDDTKLYGRLNSAIDPIEEANPGVFTNTDEGWRIWPSQIDAVRVSYYTLPHAVSWSYVPDDRGRPVYDSINSQDPQWDDLSNEEILARCCTLLGISFQSPQLVQFGQAAKQQGA